MKLFRQKDELFELMAKSSGKVAGEGAQGTQGAGGDGTSTSSRRATKTTPTTRPLPRPTASLGAPRSTTTKGTRPLGQPADANSFASPLGGPPIQRPIGELLEIEGDALVVLDDDWEAAAPPSEPIGRLLALRLDTAVVGGLLVVGLLATAFLVGRTSSDDASKPPTIALAPIEAAMPNASLTAPLPANATPAGGTTTPAGFRPGGGATTAPASAPGSAPASSPPATPAGVERSAAKGKFEIVVVATRPEKATALVKWLNENPRSPIFGRTDLEAMAKEGTVKLVGFGQKEAEVLTRVKATSDPTGGSGTFHDAFWRSVR